MIGREIDLRALLDINVLLALLDRDHVLHEQSRQWFERQIHGGWASCAVTQNGFIRILSQPGYPSPVSTGKAIRLLATATSAARHEYWRSDVSILDETIFDHSTCSAWRRTMAGASSPSIRRLRWPRYGPQAHATSSSCEPAAPGGYRAAAPP